MQPEQPAAKAPPVSQQLVPEGDFALKLATVLKLGTPTTEAHAKDMLATVGVAPKNGWIAHYPMTPIVIGQVRNAVVAAAASEKLPIREDEALQAFDGLTAEFGLAFAPGPEQYVEGQPPSGSEYAPPEVINEYYYNEGPPVITNYSPPWDYDYLYGWVPYPFWVVWFLLPRFFYSERFPCPSSSPSWPSFDQQSLHRTRRPRPFLGLIRQRGREEQLQRALLGEGAPARLRPGGPEWALPQSTTEARMAGH